MTATRRSLRITAAAIVAAVIGLVASRPTEAIIIINSRLANFGYVGLAAGQMARIHVFNQADPRGDEPCFAGLRMFDDGNNVLVESNAALRPGQSKRLSYTASRPHKVRAIVASVGPKGGNACSASFEIVNRQTGQTAVYTNSADVTAHSYDDIADWGMVRFTQP